MKLNETVQLLLEEMDKALKDIDDLSGMIRSVEDLRDSSLLLRACRDATLVAIQGAIDIGNRIISIMGWRRPESYRDVFEVLLENGVIEEKLAFKLQDLAGFRNVLVHLYWRLRLERLKRFIDQEHRSIERFRDNIIRFLDQVADAVDPDFQGGFESTDERT